VNKLQSLNTDETLSSQQMQLLDSASENLDCHKELNNVLNKIDDKQLEIARKRKRLASLQKSVTSLWLQVKERDLRCDRTDDSDEIRK